MECSNKLGQYMLEKQIPRAVIAMVFRKDPVEMSDLEQEQVLASLKACEKVDPIEAELTYLSLVEKYQ
jgi:hypothetical protein